MADFVLLTNTKKYLVRHIPWHNSPLAPLIGINIFKTERNIQDVIPIRHGL
ncbi:hypothetical protein DSUL_20016 [Desulfovibrionales bacterium]